MIINSYRYAVSGGSWTPADLTGLMSWHDASDTATITHSGGAVSQVDDKSGGGYHLRQSTGAIQPTTGTVTRNSLNTIDFSDGDRLEFDNLPITTTYSICVIGKATNKTSIAPITDTDVTRTILPIATDGNTGTEVVRVDNVDNPSGYSLLFNGETSQSVTNRDGAHTALVNGGSPFIMQVINIPETISDYIGIGGGNIAGFNFVGQMYEIITKNGSFTTADINNINSYAATKWAI